MLDHPPTATGQEELESLQTVFTPEDPETGQKREK